MQRSFLEQQVTTPSRNNAIIFPYFWDSQNEVWSSQEKGQGGSYVDYISANHVDSVHKFGYNPDVNQNVTSSSPLAVWDGTGSYVFPPDIGTGAQAYSSDNSDSQLVVVEGLDENFLQQIWSGNLDGTGYVDLDGSWSRIYRAYNNDSTNLQGDVYISPSGEPNTSYAKILQGNNQTLMAIYTIPSNFSGYFLSYNASAISAGGGTQEYVLSLATREFGKVFRVQDVDAISAEHSVHKDSHIPRAIDPKTDVMFFVTEARGNNGGVAVDFDIALI